MAKRLREALGICRACGKFTRVRLRPGDHVGYHSCAHCGGTLWQPNRQEAVEARALEGTGKIKEETA